MEYLGNLTTAGGPFCLAKRDTAASWNGTDGDYWTLVDKGGEEPVKVSYNHDNFPFIIISSEIGSLDVFEANNVIYLVDFRHAVEDYSNEETPPILDNLDFAPLCHIEDFGGDLVLFDSGSVIADPDDCLSLHKPLGHLSASGSHYSSDRAEFECYRFVWH